MLTAHSSTRMRSQHARENNHLNLHSSVSVYISLEKRILVTSCRFIRLIASTKNVPLVRIMNFLFLLIVWSSKRHRCGSQSSFLFLVIFVFYQTISVAPHPIVLSLCIQMEAYVSNEVVEMEMFGDQTFHRLATLFGAV